MTIATDDAVELLTLPYTAAVAMERDGNATLLLSLYQLVAFATAQQRQLRFSPPSARSVQLQGPAVAVPRRCV